jgi:hypothetical protein
MQNTTGRLVLLPFVLLAMALSGCASAVDDASLPPSEEGATSASQELRGAAVADADAVLDADAACDSSAAAGAVGGSYEELTSILESASVNLDGDSGALGNTCTRVCKCCKGGNRFCCSHCRFCSGPIGVSSEVFAP